MRFLACLLLLLAARAVHAQIYKCSEGGKTRFSDKPITDCKSQTVQGEVQAPAPVAEPAAPKKGQKKKVEVPKAVVEADRKCAAMTQEYRRLQRSSDEASRDRMQAMRSEYAACR